jgi:hypothetical protein
VAWSLPDGASCARLGVETVGVQVIGDEHGAGAEAACVDGTVLIPSLAPGPYDILIDAIGADALYSAREKIDVEAGFTSDEGVVTLVPSIGPAGARVSVRWTFDGEASCARAGVDAVDVVVRDGDGTAASRSFDCSAGGATLDGLPTGDATLEVRGRADADTLFETSTPITLGVVALDAGVLDLDPVRARLHLSWAFGGDPRCEAAGVSDVTVQVIDDDGVTVDGASADCLTGGIAFVGLPAAHLTFVVEGLAGTERRWQSAVALTLNAGGNPDVAIDLEPTFARATVRWLFADAGNSSDCAAAGVTSVTLQVFNPAGDAIAGGSFSCAAGSATFDGLSTGAHRFVADGYGGGGALVAQDTTGNPRGVTQTLALGDNAVDVMLE